MQLFNFRLFLRVILRNREVYALKVITLTIALTCATFITLFSIREFGYDRFHQDATSIFRLLQRNTNEKFTGNRNSNRIGPDVFSKLIGSAHDSVILSRVKVMDEVRIDVKTKTFHDQKIHAADHSLTSIFTFVTKSGSLQEFKEGRLILSTSNALKYFGTDDAVGKTMSITTFGDTLTYTVAAVYEDFPRNSHEDFGLFIHYDPSAVNALEFKADDFGVYGKSKAGSLSAHEHFANQILGVKDVRYLFQPITEIYFGPRVIGEDAVHGDEYSVFILISITTLILFLTLTGFINFTTLTLPNRVKELAIRKLAGTSELHLIISFARESFTIVFVSFLSGVLLLLLLSDWITPLLGIQLISDRTEDNILFVILLAVLVFILGLAPLIMTFRFTRATPNRLLSSVAITFPRFKAIISFLQLGISLFLIMASMVMKRQINFSLLKEPGQNFDQILYVPYPGFTYEELKGFSTSLKNDNANVVDVMATSQLPDHSISKEINSPFYFMGVDPAFGDFFNINIIRGNWFKANDGDSIMVVNEKAHALLGVGAKNVIGVFKDINGQFNKPEKPIKIKMADTFKYSFLCIKVLEVDIRKTVTYLEQRLDTKSVSFFNKRFEAWLNYQDNLNVVSDLLAIISGLLSCCAIYGLSVSLVRDKLKQIAIRKMFGATTSHITTLLLKEFASQLLIAVLIFCPLTYLVIQELLREFVYHTHVTWLDPLIPLAYCVIVITGLCSIQAFSLNKSDLTSSLKG